VQCEALLNEVGPLEKAQNAARPSSQYWWKVVIEVEPNAALTITQVRPLLYHITTLMRYLVALFFFSTPLLAADVSDWQTRTIYLVNLSPSYAMSLQ
jgi:hypothetical protein